jgi:hypothetical protein
MGVRGQGSVGWWGVGGGAFLLGGVGGHRSTAAAAHRRAHGRPANPPFQRVPVLALLWTTMASLAHSATLRAFKVRGPTLSGTVKAGVRLGHIAHWACTGCCIDVSAWRGGCRPGGGNRPRIPPHAVDAGHCPRARPCLPPASAGGGARLQDQDQAGLCVLGACSPQGRLGGGGSRPRQHGCCC